MQQILAAREEHPTADREQERGAELRHRQASRHEIVGREEDGQQADRDDERVEERRGHVAHVQPAEDLLSLLGQESGAGQWSRDEREPERDPEPDDAHGHDEVVAARSRDVHEHDEQGEAHDDDERRDREPLVLRHGSRPVARPRSTAASTVSTGR